MPQSEANRVSRSVGDQHRGGPANVMMPNSTGNTSGNPFEEPQRRMNEYTAKEIATLQSRLDQKLGPEYISSRPGAGGLKVHYLSADKCINLANEVFGFNGWSSSIQNIQIDFVEESQNTGKISLGLSVIVRVTLKDGTFHEDVGYGHIENCKGKAAAFEKAKKEGTTDALKRTLRNFGNVLGNCIYDKDYISKVTKVKSGPARWDPNELHRHPDYVPKKEPVQQQKPVSHDDDDLPPRPAEIGRLDKTRETGTFDGDGEFGSDLFDEADFGVAANGNPDEIAIEPEPQSKSLPAPPAINGQNAQSRPSANMPGPPGRPDPALITPSKPERPWNPAAASRQVPAPPALNGRQNPSAPNRPNQVQMRPTPTPTPVPPQNTQNAITTTPSGPQRSTQGLDSNAGGQLPVKRELPNMDMPPPANGSPSAAFFSARAVDLLRDNPSAPTGAPQFDPHAQSPSIRKTAGVDHTKSVPISKPMLSTASPAPNNSRDFVNPAADPTRKIGIPSGGGFGSPMNRGQSTSSYKPLTRPNIVDPRNAANPALQNGGSVGPQNINGKRPPLNDVTNATATSGGNGTAPMPGVVDPKRPRFAGDLNPQQQGQAPPPQQ